MDGRSYLGTWETKEGKLTVVIEEVGETFNFVENAEYTVNDTTLTITVNGKTTHLTKKQ